MCAHALRAAIEYKKSGPHARFFQPYAFRRGPGRVAAASLESVVASNGGGHLRSEQPKRAAERTKTAVPKPASNAVGRVRPI